MGCKNIWKLKQNRNGDGLLLQKNDEWAMLIDSFKEAFDKMESGDKIIINEGDYELSEDYDGFDKDLQIEGIGKCRIYDTSCDCDPLPNHHKLSLKNLILDISIDSYKGASLWLTDCLLTGYIDVGEDGFLDCDGCIFHGGEDAVSALVTSRPCTLFVRGCLFDGCGGFEACHVFTYQSPKRQN